MEKKKKNSVSKEKTFRRIFKKMCTTACFLQVWEVGDMLMGAIWRQVIRAQVLRCLQAQQSWGSQCGQGHPDGPSGALTLEEEIT